MFGDAYIRLRAQVGTGLYSLARLAQECDAPVETMAELQELQDGLREPFLFAAFGEAEAGKSSLLNALFGRDFTDAPARTENVTVYRYEAEARDRELDSGTVERWRPHLFLRDFTLVDTPGIGLRAEITPKVWPYVAVADLLIFVFAAARPEAERTWTLLSRLDAERLARVVFVVDVSGGEALDEAAKRLRQVMLKRNGVARPIFAIDTRGALAAQIIGDRAARAGSGLAALEEYIEREVAEGVARRAPVDLARGRAREILKELSARSRDAVQSAGRDGKLLRGMHQLIEERQDQALRQMGGILWSLAKTLETAQADAEEAFRRHLSLFGLLRAAGVWREDLERKVEAPLRDTVWSEIATALDAIEDDQRSAWDQLETQRRRSMTDCPAPRPPDFAMIRERLRDDIDTVLARHALDAGTDRRFHALFVLAGATLRVALYAVAAGGLLTGFAVVAEPSPFGKVLAGTAGIALLAGVALGLWQWRLLADFRRFCTARRDALVAEVEEHLREGIEHFAEDLADALGPVEVACAARRRTHEPLFVRAQQLDGLFARNRAEPVPAEAGDGEAERAPLASGRA